MNFTRFALACGVATLVIGPPAAVQAQDEFQILKKMKDAILSAPAMRSNSTITERDSGAVIETMLVERVRPDQIHFVTTRTGRPGSEMISDGKRSLRRTGANEAWKPFSMNLSQMFERLQKSFSKEYLRKQHGHLKPIGEDTVGGVATKVYEVTGDMGTTKVWVAADSFRPLKAERDYEGWVFQPRIKTDTKSVPDLNALSAELKAAKTKHHLHSTTTYEYDSSIKINMPPS